MEAIQTILIVVITLLLVAICDTQMRRRAGKAPSESVIPIAQPAEDMSPKSAMELLEDKTKNPEAYAQAEQMEGFSVCKDPDEVSKMLDCVCGDDPATTFAQFDYGKPGLDYKAFVTSQAVDAAVIHNHLQFVHGPNGYYSTGRTYSPDSHESYDPIPWTGLRRPEYVVQCNPTQVPDTNLDLYKRNRQFCFQT
jgi:hypothetical protein